MSIWSNSDQASWAQSLALYAWLAAGIYVVGSALFTNRIKSRESIRNRLLDRALLWGGYVLMFSHLFPSSSFLGPLQRNVVPMSKPQEVAGAGFAWVGASLVIWSRVCPGRYWSGVVALKRDHHLIQSGPYRVVRHPLYMGLILAAFGWCMCQPTWSSLLGALLLVACFERRAHKEDALLESEFGAEFDVYRQRTGRLLPRLNLSSTD